MMLPEQQRALDYLARKGTNAPLPQLRAELREAFAAAERAFDNVPVERRGRAPAPGKWSPHEILDHLVLSHEPAIAQLVSLFDGVDVEDAVPADLHRPDAERPAWEVLRAQLAAVHAELLRLAESASDATPRAPRAPVVMVLKGARWIERLDWKAYLQGIRVHTLEHLDQLRRAVTA